MDGKEGQITKVFLPMGRHDLMAVFLKQVGFFEFQYILIDAHPLVGKGEPADILDLIVVLKDNILEE